MRLLTAAKGHLKCSASLGCALTVLLLASASAAVAASPKSPIIHTTNDSYYDGGFIFLGGNVIKTNRRAARLVLQVYIENSRHHILASKRRTCSRSTSCQIGSMAKGYGNSYKVGSHYTGSLDVVAEGTYGSVNTFDSFTCDFTNGLLPAGSGCR